MSGTRRLSVGSMSSSSSSSEASDRPVSATFMNYRTDNKKTIRIVWALASVVVVLAGIAMMVMAAVVLRKTHMSDESIGADCLAAEWEIVPCVGAAAADCLVMQSSCDLVFEGELSPAMSVPTVRLHLCKDGFSADCVSEARRQYRFLFDPCFRAVPPGGHYLHGNETVRCHAYETLQSVQLYMERGIYMERTTFVIFNFSVGMGLLVLPLFLTPFLRIQKHRRFML